MILMLFCCISGCVTSVKVKKKKCCFPQILLQNTKRIVGVSAWHPYILLCLLFPGIFPQDEEEVSTDEDDDMFGSRKRMKRPARRDNDEEEAPTGKKRKDEPGIEFFQFV